MAETTRTEGGKKNHLAKSTCADMTESPAQAGWQCAVKAKPGRQRRFQGNGRDPDDRHKPADTRDYNMANNGLAGTFLDTPYTHGYNFHVFLEVKK
ncbi:MAG: hypothetical protein JW854_01980 [Actinobacteria bacterium]|nr:hypothetical protein [Actinomycetota bacterium]